VRNGTVTASHARRLRLGVFLWKERFEELQRVSAFTARAVTEARENEKALRTEIEQLCARLDQMGRDMGRANTREVSTRLVAETALNALATVSRAAGASTPPYLIACTLRALERDGRAELAKIAESDHLSATGGRS
jgi:hypothetical protein